MMFKLLERHLMEVDNIKLRGGGSVGAQGSGDDQVVAALEILETTWGWGVYRGSC